ESRNLNRVQARQFAARRLKLDRRSVSCQVANVCPVEHFNRLARTKETARRKSSIESLQTNVGPRDPQLPRGFNELHVVHAHHSFAFKIADGATQHLRQIQHYWFTGKFLTSFANHNMSYRGRQ